MALKHVNTRKWTSPVFVGWLVANLKGHQSAQAPRICFKFLSELSNVENSSAVTSSLTLNMTMWWAPASGETDKDGEFTTKTWENDQELPSNPLVFSEVKIATSCTSSGRSSPIWVAIGVWSIPGMHWTIQWKVVPWSGGKIHPSNLQSWARDQHTSRWAIFEDMELPLLSTFKVTSLSPAKTKKDLVNLQKRSKKHNITENITSLRNENKWNIEPNHPPGHCRVARLPGSMRLSKAIIIFICCSSCSKALENPNVEGKLCPRDFSGVHPLWHFSRYELHTITYMIYIYICMIISN